MQVSGVYYGQDLLRYVYVSAVVSALAIGPLSGRARSSHTWHLQDGGQRRVGEIGLRRLTDRICRLRSRLVYGAQSRQVYSVGQAGEGRQGIGSCEHSARHTPSGKRATPAGQLPCRSPRESREQASSAVPGAHTHYLSRSHTHYQSITHSLSLYDV